MNKKLSIAGLSVLIVAAATAASLEGFTVRYVPKEGQTIKYRTAIQIDFGGGQKFNAKILTEEKTSKIAANGDYTITQTELEKEINGKKDPTANAPSPKEITYHANGEVSNIGPTASPYAYRMSNLSAVIDPGKPVNVGDGWTRDFKANTQTGAVPYKAEYKVLGEEKVDGYDTIKLHSLIKENDGADSATNDRTLWLDKTDGTTVKSEYKWTHVTVPGSINPIDAVLTLTREK